MMNIGVTKTVLFVSMVSFASGLYAQEFSKVKADRARMLDARSVATTSPKERLLASIPKLPPSQALPPYKDPDKPSFEQNFGIVERRRQFCTNQAMKENTVFSEIVALDPNIGTIWPGALFHGATLNSGRLTPINLARTPGLLSVVNLTKIGTNNVLLTTKMRKPSFEASLNVVQSLTNDPRNLARQQPSLQTLSISEVESFDQSMSDIGVSGHWVTGSLASSLKTAATKKKHGLVVRYIQTYYDLHFNDPLTLTSFLSPSVSLSQLQAVTHKPSAPGDGGDPIMYISDVKMGRMVLIAISSDQETAEVERAIRASFSGLGGGGDGHISETDRHTLENSEIDGIVIGGSASAGGQLLSSLAGGKIDGLSRFITEGATYNPNTSPGVAIAYTARYLDGSYADTSFNADFSRNGCRTEEIPIRFGRITYDVGDDGKDDVMYPYLEVVRGGEQLVNVDGQNWERGEWRNDTHHGPFQFDISDLALSSCSNLSATFGQRSYKDESPEWRTTVQIEFLIDNNWTVVRGRDSNTSEFTWGDNHRAADTRSLACPF